MTRGSDMTLSAITSWVLLATGASIGLMVYALLTFISLLSTSSAQVFMGLA